jgi:UDP-N-acetylglucosamine acyltransferase
VNNTALAGHVYIGDWAILSGYTLVHQFCKIGAHSFTGMGTAVGKDIPAYVMVTGNPAEAKSINSEGLRRRGFSSEEIAIITKAYKLIYRRGLTIDEALVEVELLVPECERLIPLIQSIKESTRGIVR